MSNELNNFLEKYKTNDLKNCTHITYDTKITYLIPDNHINIFYNLYNNALLNNTKLHIQEISKQYGPIIIDIDMQYDKKINNRIYTNIIEKIIQIYIQLIQKYINVNTDKLQCFLLEKKEPTFYEGIYKDGIHLIFPYICIPYYFQEYLRNKFINIAIDMKLFDESYNFNNIFSTLDNIYNYPRPPWFLYGSSKTNYYNPYLLTKIYTSNLQLLNIKQYSVLNLIYLLSIRKYNENNINSLKYEFTNNKNIDNTYINYYWYFFISLYILIVIHIYKYNV